MSTYQGHNEDASGNILLNIGNGMTAVVETGTTASQAYTVGEYLFFNNRLCKVSTAIASGDTLEVGTNVSTTTIGAELTDHLVASDGTEFYFDVLDDEYGFYPSASKDSDEFVAFGGTDSVIEIWEPANATASSPLVYANSNGSYVYNAGTYTGLFSSSTAASNNTRFAFTATQKCKATFTVNSTTLYAEKDFSEGETMMDTYSYVGGGAYSLIVWSD